MRKLCNEDMCSNKISVIIPCYNAEKYIDRCVESVLNQTYRNLEIILIDDGSTDDTWKLLDFYRKKDKRILLLKQRNKGAGAARNAGLDVAQGKYVGFVDSDDWIELDMYEYLIEMMENERADIAACDYYSANKKTIKKKHVEENIRVMDSDELMLFFLRVKGEKSFYAVWNMLYKRDIICNCRFPEGKITEDMLFNYRVYCNCQKYVLSNQKKYFYFFNPNGVTRKILGEKDLALLTNWDVVVEDIRDRKPEMALYALMNRWRSDFTLLSKAFLFGYDKKEITDEIINNLTVDLNKHKTVLLKSQMLDWKRKLLLIYICMLQIDR